MTSRLLICDTKYLEARGKQYEYPQGQCCRILMDTIVHNIIVYPKGMDVPFAVSTVYYCIEYIDLIGYINYVDSSLVNAFSTLKMK